MKQTETTQNLKNIFSKYTLSVLQDKNRFLALVSDFLPSVNFYYEQKIIKAIANVNIKGTAFFEQINETNKKQFVTLSKNVVSSLKKQFSEQDIVDTLNCFASAIYNEDNLILLQDKKTTTTKTSTAKTNTTKTTTKQKTSNTNTISSSNSTKNTSSIPTTSNNTIADTTVKKTRKYRPRKKFNAERFFKVLGIILICAGAALTIYEICKAISIMGFASIVLALFCIFLCIVVFSCCDDYEVGIAIFVACIISALCVTGTILYITQPFETTPLWIKISTPILAGVCGIISWIRIWYEENF